MNESSRGASFQWKDALAAVVYKVCMLRVPMHPQKASPQAKNSNLHNVLQHTIEVFFKASAGGGIWGARLYMAFRKHWDVFRFARSS